jgi:broad specificity phosphatase PhoE
MRTRTCIRAGQLRAKPLITDFDNSQLRLFLIRHGETEWSVSGRHTGRTEISLTQRGEEQARRLGELLEQYSFAHVFCSPRLRARRTCELAGLAVAAEIRNDLAEWDYGNYEGRRTSEIVLEQPRWNLWSDGCPGGETPLEVSARADRVISDLFSLSGNVALFSHGHFSCALATRWIGQPLMLGQHLVLDPASLGILGHPARHPEIQAIVQWNTSIAPGSA